MRIINPVMLSRHISTTLKNGLLAYYSCNDTVNDSHTGNKHATGSNISYDDGKLGRAMYFNSTLNAFASFDYQLVNNVSTFSISFWFKTNSTGGIFAFQNTSPFAVPSNYAPGVYVGNNNKLVGAHWNGSRRYVVSTTNVNDNNWHHGVYRISADNMTLHIDGVLSATYNSSTLLTTVVSNSKMQIGTNYTNGWGYANSSWWKYEGYLQAFGIYNRYITDAEIADLWNDGNGLPYTSF